MMESKVANGNGNKGFYWLLGLVVVLVGAVWGITWAATSNLAANNEIRIRDMEKRMAVMESNYQHIMDSQKAQNETLKLIYEEVKAKR